MAWANIIAIALLAPKAVALLKDYEKQKKEGKDPAFLKIMRNKRKKAKIQPSIRKNSESKMRPELEIAIKKDS